MGDFETVENELEEFGVVADAQRIPGLDIGSNKLVGIGVIVKTEEEARYVTHDILTLIDRKVVGRYHFHHVLATDLLPSTVALYDPAKVQEAIYSAVDFDEHFDYPKSEVEKTEAEFSKWAGRCGKQRGFGGDGTGRRLLDLAARQYSSVRAMPSASV